MDIKHSGLILVILALVFTSGCQPAAPTSQIPTATPNAISTPTNTAPTPINLEIPYELISEESLFAYLEDLTSIQPYSGWRNSASSGEAEALDYVEAKLTEFSNLQTTGLELERQSFNVYLSTEIWDAGLTLTVNNQEIKVPAEALRGHRYDRYLAAYFDSDGVINDSNPDPMTAAGSPLIVRDEDTLYSLTADELKGRILFLDYSLIDRITNKASDNRLGANENTDRLIVMVDQGLAGVVLVTQYSNKSGESYGLLISEGANFSWEIPSRRVPMLFVRIEDLSPAGIVTWEDLGQIESAQLTLDTDVFFPGKSGNLIARIPGADSSKAVILGAHIDSPNTPGAGDDGSGTAALLEIARVLNESQIQPPVDIYLAWFGSEEIALYGSSHFAYTHQELMDHTLAIVVMDGLGYPLDGKTSNITLGITPYARFGDDRMPLPDFLSNAVAAQGITLDRFVDYEVIADNSSFDVYNVPNVYLGYLNAADLENTARPIHYSSHWHDPYETVDHLRVVGAEFVDMTKVMLAAALEIGRLHPDLRVTPAPTRRALILASHTESFGITALRDLGMAFGWEGFDVDLIPYGQAITPADLQDVGVIVLPPALNFPGQPPEIWSETELALLQGYVADGGLLVVVNSAYNYASTISLRSPNLNARSVNPLLEPVGIRFMYGGTGGYNDAQAVSEHPLMLNATYLTFNGNNAVAFRIKSGLELFRAAGHTIVALVDYGTQGGQVLVVAELGLLQDSTAGAKNMQFLQNLAHYARAR